MSNTPQYVSVLDVEEWATKCINLERERDEARAELADWRDSAANVRKEYEDEQHCSCVPILRKLLKDAERERNEAREDLEFRRGLYKVLDAANSHLMTANEEAVKLARTLKQERDEAREDLSAMVDIAFKHLTSLLILRDAEGEEETREVIAALKLWKEMNQ